MAWAFVCITQRKHSSTQIMTYIKHTHTCPTTATSFPAGIRTSLRTRSHTSTASETSFPPFSAAKSSLGSIFTRPSGWFWLLPEGVAYRGTGRTAEETKKAEEAVLICCLLHVIWPLTTYSLGDGAPFLLIEISPTLGRGEAGGGASTQSPKNDSQPGLRQRCRQLKRDNPGKHNQQQKNSSRNPTAHRRGRNRRIVGALDTPPEDHLMPPIISGYYQYGGFYIPFMPAFDPFTPSPDRPRFLILFDVAPRSSPAYLSLPPPSITPF